MTRSIYGEATYKDRLQFDGDAMLGPGSRFGLYSETADYPEFGWDNLSDLAYFRKHISGGWLQFGLKNVTLYPGSAYADGVLLKPGGGGKTVLNIRNAADDLDSDVVCGSITAPSITNDDGYGFEAAGNATFNGVYSESYLQCGNTVEEFAGMIKFDGVSFQGYDGAAWVGFGASGSSGYVQFNNGSGGFGADSSFYWDNTNKYLGIGVSPVTDLDITKSVSGAGVLSRLWNSNSNAGSDAVQQILSSGGNAQIILGNYDSGLKPWSIANSRSASHALIIGKSTAVGSSVAASFDYNTGASEGRVGINKIGPSYPLDVQGKAAISAGLGVWGVAPPTSQPAKINDPSDLSSALTAIAAVIDVLEGAGLSAAV